MFDDIKKQSVKSMISVIGKGNISREIPINNIVAGSILEIHRYNMSLSVIIKMNSPFILTHIRTRMSRIALNNIVNKHLGTHTHILRHTYATCLIDSGVDILSVSKLLGHSEPRTTYNFYVHKSLSDLIKANDKLVEYYNQFFGKVQLRLVSSK